MTVADDPGADVVDVGFRPGKLLLEIPARVEFVSLVRVVVAAVAELQPNLDKDRIEDLKVAVSEATTNAIEAHGLSGSIDRIHVRCFVADDEVSVVVHDRGFGFDPDAISELPPPESPERLAHEAGLGVRLMTKLADESEIRSSPQGTDVRLVVYTSTRSAQVRKRPS